MGNKPLESLITLKIGTFTQPNIKPLKQKSDFLYCHLYYLENLFKKNGIWDKNEARSLSSMKGVFWWIESWGHTPVGSLQAAWGDFRPSPEVCFHFSPCQAPSNGSVTCLAAMKSIHISSFMEAFVLVWDTSVPLKATINNQKLSSAMSGIAFVQNGRVNSMKLAINMICRLNYS